MRAADAFRETVPDIKVANARSSEMRMRAASLDAQLAELRAKQASHPLWDCELLRAFRAGALGKADLQYVFSQYYLYSKSFTRFLAGVMAGCENDYFRSKLSENLWEEGGGCEPSRRHAQIFRDFLTNGLGIASLDAIEYDDFTKLYVREYLAACLTSSAASGAAFLSLGTEGIVARLYGMLVVGLEKAGIAEEHLEFFRIHMACDDEHAVTLEEMMTSYAHEPGWLEACEEAMENALTLRKRFFDNLFVALRERRLGTAMARIQGRKALTPATPEGIRHAGGGIARSLYKNVVEKLNVDFTVERLPLDAEVLDPRLVRIPAGKFNEKHKHAHETFMHVLRGRGRVLIDQHVLEVSAGDSVLVPRWSLHQTQNLGEKEMTFLAVTDFHLTEKAYLGDAKAYRMQREDEPTERGIRVSASR